MAYHVDGRTQLAGPDVDRRDQGQMGGDSFERTIPQRPAQAFYFGGHRWVDE
jgi:hypothetical protein